MNKNIIAIIVLAAAGIGAYYLYTASNPKVETDENRDDAAPAVSDKNSVPEKKIDDVIPEPAEPAVKTPEKELENKAEPVIGKSAGGRDIFAYYFGTGPDEILVVGGVHGAYAWNTSLLAYQLMDYLKAKPETLPENIRLTVIPTLNPDGLSKVVSVTGPFEKSDVSSLPELKVAGRFNANSVDINRNFDCNWQASGIWQNKAVSGGTAAFSEPESQAVKNYAQKHKLTAVVAWYSAGGGVFASSCGGGIMPETQAITDIYAKASGYPAYNNFASYQISGDMTDWFAKNNVPAISVLLSGFDDTERDKNLAGLKMLFQHYAK